MVECPLAKQDVMGPIPIGRLKKQLNVNGLSIIRVCPITAKLVAFFIYENQKIKYN